MAALFLTEITFEAKGRGEDLMVATLDTHKTFKIVLHPILLRDLWETGISPELWMAVHDLYDDTTESVICDGELS